MNISNINIIYEKLDWIINIKKHEWDSHLNKYHKNILTGDLSNKNLNRLFQIKIGNFIK